MKTNPGDCIRTIEASAEERWFDEMTRNETTNYFFDKVPKSVERGTLMFFAYHGKVRSVGIVTKVGTTRGHDDYYWIDVSYMEYFTCDLPYKGFASVRYVGNLRYQYNGEYTDLVDRLQLEAQDYRARLRDWLEDNPEDELLKGITF